MMKVFRIFRFIMILVILTYVLINHGRSFYGPAVKKIKGKETVDMVIERIEVEVLRRLKQNFKSIGIKGAPNKLILVALKEEQVLEVYANLDGKIKLLKQYPFTAFSGELGPKLKEGDRQIPEGVYGIEYLNPNSSYYLSLKVSYPNAFDRLKTKYADQSRMGGDIFIHGKAVTIGCIPIGDEAIEEIFYMATKATKSNIKVIISPWDFRKKKAYPSIPSIDWEQELYDKIAIELEGIPLTR